MPIQDFRRNGGGVRGVLFSGHDARMEIAVRAFRLAKRDLDVDAEIHGQLQNVITQGGRKNLIGQEIYFEAPGILFLLLPLYTSATSRSKFGFFSAWSFRATPQAVAIRSSIVSECPLYSASSRRAITDCVVPTFLASSA